MSNNLESACVYVCCIVCTCVSFLAFLISIRTLESAADQWISFVNKILVALFHKSCDYFTVLDL